jgi:hypothetical protein
VHAPSACLDRFGTGAAENPDAGVATRADDHHRDPAAVDKSLGFSGADPGELDHPTQAVLLPASSGHSTPVPENVMRPASRRKEGGGASLAAVASATRATYLS